MPKGWNSDRRSGTSSREWAPEKTVVGGGVAVAEAGGVSRITSCGAFCDRPGVN